MRIGYVLKRFPRLSETFILNEILTLEAQGVEVQIFSLNPPCDARYHGALSELKAGVTYVPRADSSEMWRAVRSACGGCAFEPGPTGAALRRALEQRGDDGLKLLLQCLWLSAEVRKRGIDHLHAHFATAATVAAMTAHTLSGLPFSFTAHAKDIYHEEIDRPLVVEALERCAFTITVTDYNVERLAEFSPAARQKVRRIYNGLPLDRLSPSPEPANGVPRIVSAGRLVEKKGFPYLIEACRLLRERGHRFECSIIGAGPAEPELSLQIDRAGLGGSVSLHGAQSQENVLELIRRGHLMALACIRAQDGDRDALPTALLEAMALARPVVSTDLEGVTEIVEDGRTGFLVPQRDAEALAGALARLLENASLRADFGRRARARAERLFSADRNVAELAKLFRNVAETRDREIMACA